MKNFYLLPLQALNNEAASDFMDFVQFVIVHILNGVMTHTSGYATVEEACKNMESVCEEWSYLND